MSKEHDAAESVGQAVESWELEMVNKVCRAFRTNEPDELEAELARKLVQLKQQMPKGIRVWKAYLAKFLYNKASNWVRDSRRREKRYALAAVSVEETMGQTHRVSLRTDFDTRMGMAGFWKELSPELRRFLELLVSEGGNQTKAARRLGIHRNTARAWMGAIQRTLRRHGF